MASGDASAKMQVVFVLGPPGSGKGTQCQRINETFNFAHLSAGDLLRAERQSPGSEHGELIEEHIQNGTIVPVEITCALLERAMLEQRSEVRGFLIDGFPRNKDNLDGWQRAMADKVDVRCVLFIECAAEICVNRCLKRGQTSGRSDDNEASLTKRINTYNSQTMGIIEHYQKLGQVRTVDGKQTADEVFEKVTEIFAKEGFEAAQ